MVVIIQVIEPPIEICDAEFLRGEVSDQVL